MTEGVSQRFKSFDQWSTKDAVESMYEGQLIAMSAIKPAIDDIVRASEMAAERLNKKGKLVYVGAGTSGRLAVQDGAELAPTFGWPQDRVAFCIAGGMKALTISAEGAEDILSDGVDQINAANVNENDVIIAVAASGRTPFTLGALQQANTLGALTIGIANNPNTQILKEAKYGILIETGSELIAGSTRMKAGTTQKAVLNILSTAIMTRIGRVYKGYMIDMVISNKKLESRAINMIRDITNCSRNRAVIALQVSNQHIKTAVLVASGETLEESVHLLKQAGGNLRKAFTLIKET